LCFAVLALGVYISYSILDFPDLSVDGTFPLGGVVCTILMLKLGIPALPAILLSFFAGLAAGVVTGVLHVKFNISKLLSGIIVMTALLSITLALTKLLTRTGLTTTIFSFRSENLRGIFGGRAAELLGNANRDYMILIIELVFVVAVKIIIDLFLKTKLGYMLRATGDNEMLVVSLGKDSGTYKILGIALANGFVSMAGALYANLFSQYDNSCGSGKVVMALASVIIGIAVFSKIRFITDTTAVIFGAVIYSLCLNYLVLVDTNGIYLKLLNAVMFALILIFNDKTSGLVSKRSKLKGGHSNAGA
ncbi:MAG: ABC transporter permease, partial [Acutalibacteraceae bacterium]|nr:ABC transporter permease [Acutalibacteraceae bacterium]